MQNGYRITSGADPRVAVDHDMGDQFGAVLDHHIGADRAERPDPHADAQLGAARDDAPSDG